MFSSRDPAIARQRPSVSTELLYAFVLFAIATLFTPGPNNVMLMAQGLNFGVRGAVPAAIGVTVGFSFMVFLVGLGLGAVFEAYPALYAVIKYAGAAYLLCLAWMIATSGAAKGRDGAGKPISFLQAVAFQWVNPKGWVMAVGAVTTYAAVTQFPFNMILIAAIFGVLGTASSFTWVLFGTGLRRIVTDPRIMRIFNVVMALLLIASLYPIVAGLWH
jgi:threonine/homoserine/homoserine lactone efflux protein